MPFILFSFNLFPVGSDEYRNASRKEINEIITHITDLPPSTSDVTVLVKFELPRLSKKELASSIDSVFSRDESERGNPTSPEKLAQEKQNELNRLLQEQESPRTVKEGWRKDGLRYRVDRVQTRTGVDIVDAQSEFRESFASLRSNSESEQLYLKLDWSQKIKSITDSRHGGVIQTQDVWDGDTVNYSCAIALRRALGMEMTKFEKKNSIPSEREISNLLSRTHKYVEILVKENSDTRRFRLKIQSSGELFNIDVPREGFSPVYYIEAVLPNGDVSYKKTLHSSGNGDEPMRWTVEYPMLQRGRVKVKEYTLLERSLNTELPDDTFSLDREDGWALVNYHASPPVFIGPAGEKITPRNLVVNNTVADGNHGTVNKSRLIVFLTVNIFLLFCMLFLWHLFSAKKRKS